MKKSINETIVKTSKGIGYRIKENGKKFIINESLEELYEVQCDCVRVFSNGLSVVCKDGLYGAINAEGKLIIPLEFDGLGCYENGYFVAKKGEYVGCINKKNEVVIDFEWSSIQMGEVGVAVAQRLNLENEKVSQYFVDILGNSYEIKKCVYAPIIVRDSEVIEEIPSNLKKFKMEDRKIYIIKTNSNHGVINALYKKVGEKCFFDFGYKKFGKELVKIKNYKNGSAVVNVYGKEILIGSNIQYSLAGDDCKYVKAFKYNVFDPKHKNMVALYDESGDMVIDYIFDRIVVEDSYYESCGRLYAYVYKGSNVGLINIISGDMVVPCEYNSIYVVSKCKAVCMKRREKYIINF